MPARLEQAVWVDWRMPLSARLAPARVYFGHESCERLLPVAGAILGWAKSVLDRGAALTLVTPFLTNPGLDHARRLIDCLSAIDGGIEVVCSDWGLLDVLAREKAVTPVVGRLLAARPADPRLMRIFIGGRERTLTHLDGTLCRLKYRPPSAELARHYRGCWLDRPELISWFISRGVRRAEIDNTGHGIEIMGFPGWSYSLHTPEVLVAVMRRCPGTGEDFSAPSACPSSRCGEPAVEWETPGFPAPLQRRQNALFYEWPRLPDNLESLPIDRIVRRAALRTP
jgi:hypothetical protein